MTLASTLIGKSVASAFGHKQMRSIIMAAIEVPSSTDPQRALDELKRQLRNGRRASVLVLAIEV